jgi:glycosyltransferase involved in cell wall biosynthesis
VSVEEQHPLVGVIIPMWNASATIDATISSVCAQTYGKLDIVVVDDGSTDDSSTKIQTWTQQDPRVRLVHQSNSGVAAARNFGAANTMASYLAFIDADDLWAPEKIATQIKLLHGSEQTVGLVYSWYAEIDAADRVLLLHHPQAEGWVLKDLLRSNIVGNGSSALIRRWAFEQAGGFDTTLRDRDAQGCEDLAIYLRIAEHFEFRVVKRHLVGYRFVGGNMSHDVTRMLRSYALVLSEYRGRYPELGPEMDHQLDMVRYWLLIRAISTGRYELTRELTDQIWHSRPGLIVPRLKNALSTITRARAPRLLKTTFGPLLDRGGRRVRYLQQSW